VVYCNEEVLTVECFSNCQGFALLNWGIATLGRVRKATTDECDFLACVVAEVVCARTFTVLLKEPEPDACFGPVGS